MKPRFSLIWRVAGVVPIDQAGAGQLAEQKLEIALQRQFLQGLAVLDAQLDAARFGLRQQLPQQPRTSAP